MWHFIYKIIEWIHYKIQWIFNQNTPLFIYKTWVCNMASILSHPKGIDSMEYHFGIMENNNITLALINCLGANLSISNTCV